MQENDLQNAAFNWSVAFVRALYSEGVNHVVISPGSRSTALTLAFSAHAGFKKHICIDERSAAFTALGLSKATGMPAALVCTSGTALANYYPAVIEASQSNVPLIILSADRPPHYRGLGASQTIDQLKIFGSYPVLFHEVGEPKNDAVSRRRLQLAATQAVQISVEKAGVAHLNFPFSKPFEPNPEYLDQIELENEQQTRERSPNNYTHQSSRMEMGSEFWTKLYSAKRPLIMVGPTSHADPIGFIPSLAHALNAPILAEPGSQIDSSSNTIEGFDGFLRETENRNNLQADLILRFGHQPVSKALNLYLEQNPEAHQISFMNPNTWVDGSLSSHQHIRIGAPLSIPEKTGNAEGGWLEKWKFTEKNFKDFRKKQLQSSAPLTDGYVISTLTRNAPKDAFCMLSNSFPVRDMSMFGVFDGSEIYVNRGAAGIDGITSTAIGLSIGSEKPGFLLIGDIAFLHDSNALLMAKNLKKPLVIVVLNNGGGTIFRMLPVHGIKEKYDPYFETPQSANIADLCKAHSVDHSLISTSDEIIPTFEKLIQKNGVHVMECITDADESMQLRRSLWNYKMPDQI